MPVDTLSMAVLNHGFLAFGCRMNRCTPPLLLDSGKDEPGILYLFTPLDPDFPEIIRSIEPYAHRLKSFPQNDVEMRQLRGKEALERSANKMKAKGKREQPLKAKGKREEPPKKKIRSSGSRKRGLSGGERRGKKAKK